MVPSLREYLARNPLDYCDMPGFEAEGVELGILGVGPRFEPLSLPGVAVAACMAIVVGARHFPNRDLSGLVAFLRKRCTS